MCFAPHMASLTVPVKLWLVWLQPAVVKAAVSLKGKGLAYAEPQFFLSAHNINPRGYAPACGLGNAITSAFQIVQPGSLL
jgi:hypothetical protein